MPAGNQDLAGDGGLGGVALAAAALLDVAIELVPRIVEPPGLLRGFDRCQRSIVEPLLDSFPVRDFSPD